METERKALIAMSGGVDSSVAAWLMQQQGYSCIGVTMKLFQNADIVTDSHTCCSLDDVEDARMVARSMGIPHYVMQFTDRFREMVMDKFVRCYEQGLTPNPCVDCNRYLKFDKLYQRALELGCSHVVTGHYARIAKEGERYLLKTGLDESKDQSYVLYNLTQEQLAHTLFPLGELSKAEARKIAEEQHFVNAAKHDSQDICFVPDGDYVAFMERYTGKHYEPGDFLDISGKVVGQHRGAVGYTLGQRKGLGLAMGAPVYVCGKNMAKNTVTVGPESELFSTVLWAEDMNWISIPGLEAPMRVQAKARYRQKAQWATIYPENNGSIRCEFDTPQRAITPGQSLVLYDGDVVVGGGTIIIKEETTV